MSNTGINCKYFSEIVKAANIYIYQLCMLYMQFCIITDIDHCGNLVEECEPDGYSEMSPKQQVSYWNDLQDSIDRVDTYRYFEIFTFDSQLLAIVVYIIYSKSFLKAKKYLGTFDKYDPFQKILADTNQDFLDQENLFMITITLQVMNMTLNSLFIVVIENDIESILDPNSTYSGNVELLILLVKHIEFYLLPSEILSFFVWLAIFWFGTKFNELYSRRNYVLISFIAFASVFTHLYIIMEINQLRKNNIKVKLNNIIVCSMLN